VSDTNFEEANGSDKSEDDKPSDNSSWVCGNLQAVSYQN
jgi:hypothetical protein